MRQTLMILALYLTATAPRADTHLTPWVFDLQGQFTTCINRPANDQTATPYTACQRVLSAAYTLRRELAYALNHCLSSDDTDCINAFNSAGFPARALNVTELNRCEMLGDLNKVEAREIPENSCIEQLALTIEQNSIPTSHNTKISCAVNYVECLEIVSKGTKYWENSVWLLHIDHLQTIPNDPDFANAPASSHRYYSLLERQHRLRIDLAETNCHLQTVMPHWANSRDYDGCMGEAYAAIWLAHKSNFEE